MPEKHSSPGAPDEAPTAPDRDEDADITSGVTPDVPRLLSGTPVFGRDGTRLGELTRDGEQDGHLVMHRMMGGPEIALPLSDVLHYDAAGVYTDLTWRDLDAKLPPPPPGSEMGLLDAFATGAEAAHANRFPDDEPE
jgi:hypothetical protein